VDEEFHGEFPRIASWSKDRTRFIVTTESGDRSPAIYAYDASEPSVKQIGSANAALQGVRLPSRSEYNFTARDGTSIPGYLTRPLDATGRTPLVVLPHGGPASRDYAGFDWMAHFLATRGYTVLQPNFRGSAGYGTAWEKAGHGEWGIGVMQHDLSDGVAALIAEELVDPQRVCIVGGSYGGYAALAGAVFTPELYRCAAAIAPVADLVDMLGFERTRRGGLSATVSYWREAMGGGEPDGLNGRLRAASPAAHAERASAPILLIHGREDSVVPIAQSRAMQSALQAAGKRVELIELDGEDHWLSVAPTRLATLQALDRFLAEHLGD
jgi:dipeptidyl aminopeptidase/acylaminoacyl peptidase